jgi:hypothetical protein
MSPARRRISNVLITLSVILLIANLFVFIHWFNALHVHMICAILFYPLIFTAAISIYFRIPQQKTWHEVPVRIWLKSLSGVILSIGCFYLGVMQLVHFFPQNESLFGLEYLGVGAIAAFSACRLPLKSLRQHRTCNGLCLACGYDLRASPTRCPECGTIPSQYKKISPPDSARSRRRPAPTGNSY